MDLKRIGERDVTEEDRRRSNGRVGEEGRNGSECIGGRNATRRILWKGN